MSDTYYRVVRFIGRKIFRVSSSPTVIGQHHVPAQGACIIAATHQSPYDVALLIRHNERLLDFVSIVEVFRNPFVAWFYGSMNAFPLDRSKPDSKTVRIILDRLERGRIVAMFPEGGFRRGRESVVYTRRIRRGIGRIAHLTRAPIVPCVLINTDVYARILSWFPFRGVRYGLMYGPPLPPDLEPEQLEEQLVDAFVSLHGRLREAMGLPAEITPANTLADAPAVASHSDQPTNSRPADAHSAIMIPLDNRDTHG